jgi:hypothetical protein
VVLKARVRGLGVVQMIRRLLEGAELVNFFKIGLPSHRHGLVDQAVPDMLDPPTDSFGLCRLRPCGYRYALVLVAKILQ